MKLIDQFRSGWRNIRRQKLRSTLTVFAIVIGAVSVTVMLSLVTSARGFLTSSFEKTGEDRRVIATPTPGLDYSSSLWQTWADGSGVKLTDERVKELAALPGVAHATGITNLGYFDSVSLNGMTLTMKQTNTVAYDPNGTITREIVAGRNLQPGDSGVLVSTSMANSLGFRGRLAAIVGASLDFTYRPDMGKGASVTPPHLPVVGVFVADGQAIEATLETARSVMPVFERCDGGSNGTQPTCTKDSDLDRNGFGAVYLDVANKRDIDSVANAVQKLGMGAAAGKDQLQQQQQAFLIIGAVLGGIGGISLFVAAIGVINTMVMATLERTREIGIMRAIGATKRTVRRLFTVEAGLLGFLGGGVGVGISYGLKLIANKVINEQLSKNGVTARNVIQIPPQLALAVLGVTTVIGMLAGRLPARRAANLDPVEALRHE
jgi:ABC-type antimicrobial peptide transport system permease subunit